MAKWRYPMLGLLAALMTPLVMAAGLPAYTGKFNEAYRPAYHFTPPNGWMNDPNGLIFHKGRYHLFYQYHPDATVWGPMHWGHAESTDLTHWTHQPIALYPDALGWIFSGSAVTDSTNSAGFGAEALVAVFTYHNDAIWKQGRKNTESQGLAYSLDAGRSWTKYAGNPVLDNSGEQDFRDPKVFRHGDGWRMVLAAGDRIKIFSSADLKQWRFESDFKEDEPGADLGVWECPDLLRLRAEDGRERWLMIVNHGDKAPNGGSGTRYFVGDFDGRQFTATQPARWLDAGTDFYAGVSFADAPGGKP
uniref:glycoside hydrolase family 32 protein n=1 Tax=Arenimonas sp. GDDSR-1 TaxID=2950125 RepID=UPI0026250C1F